MEIFPFVANELKFVVFDFYETQEPYVMADGCHSQCGSYLGNPIGLLTSTKV
jgi:hypothetical protein